MYKPRIIDFTEISQNCSLFCNEVTNCTSQGTCNTEGQCKCFSSHYGDHCEFTHCPDCVFGTCNNLTGICKCEPHYYGMTCDVYCDPTLNCTAHGVCGENGNCVCNADWVGFVSFLIRLGEMF
jgi:hypothetical protein